MVGSVGNGLMDLGEKVEPLPEEFDPKEIVEPLPTESNGIGGEEGNGKMREIVLGRNVHTTCFSIKEPDADDEETGEREANMASVLARYRKSLIERTKHHLELHLRFLAEASDFWLSNTQLLVPIAESRSRIKARQAPY